jgi:hypothetical protein
MKRALLTALLATVSFAAAAADYYVVVPVSRKAVAAPATPIAVSLNSYGLPQGTVGVPYAGFNFKDVLVVTGAPDYTGNGVTWAVAAGVLPDGIALSQDGSIAGQPSTAGRATFTLTASYKNTTAQQSYDILVASRTAGINLAGLLANYPLAPATPAASGNVALSDYNAPGLSTSLKPSANFAGAANLTATSGFANNRTGVVSGAGDVSVGAWVRTTATATQRIVQQRSAGDDSTTINGQFLATTIAGKLCYADGSSAAFGTTVCHSKLLNDGNWHHVGFTRPAAGGVRLYVDGVGQSFAYPVRNYQLRPGISIGYDQRDSSNGFTGGIADVWLFGRALTDAEFMQAYTSAAPLQ